MTKKKIYHPVLTYDNIDHQPTLNMKGKSSSILNFPIKSGLKTLRHPKRESERIQRIAKGKGAYD